MIESAFAWFGTVVASMFGGLAIYFAVAGYYHYRYYVRRGDEPEAWKLQPKRVVKPGQQRRAIVASSRNLAIGGVITGTLVFAMQRGMPTPIYFDVDDYGWGWTLLGLPLLFVLVDGAAYYVHRTLHRPFFYKRFHKFHHRWGAPTPWVVVAVHPVEFLMLQAATFLPLFLLPFHYLVVIAVFVYVLVFNIVDHSGVRLTSMLPWQGPSAYHDDHHVHFHVNFGQHLTLFDRLHGTLRRERRRYGVENFGGRGQPDEEESAPPPFVRY